MQSMLVIKILRVTCLKRRRWEQVIHECPTALEIDMTISQNLCSTIA